jgi:hypothetical protein
MHRFYDKVIKAGLGLLLVAVPLFFVYHWEHGLFFSIYDEAKEALAQALILILFCAWLLKMNSSGEFHFRKNPLNLPLLVFISIMLFSLLWAKNPWQGFVFVRRWVAHILLYSVVVNNVKTLREIRAFITVMVSTAVLVAAYGIGQYYGWEFPYLYQVITLNSTMGNPNFAGAYLAGIFPLGLSLLLYGVKKSPVRRWYYLTALIIFIHLTVARSRASWVGLIIAMIVLVVLSLRKRIFPQALIISIFSIVMITHFSLRVITPSRVKSVGEKAKKYTSKFAQEVSSSVSGTGSQASSLAGPAPDVSKVKPDGPSLSEKKVCRYI